MSHPKESPGSYVSVVPIGLSVPPIFSTRDWVSSQEYVVPPDVEEGIR